MYSVVFATMWRYEPFTDFLADIVNHHLVDEVIIIDNDNARRPNHHVLFHPKVKILDFGRNIYLNPAWNVGIAKAKNERVCVCNDDIIFDIRVFDRAYHHITPDLGVMGLKVNPVNEHFVDGLIRIIPWERGMVTYAFALVFFMYKANYEPTPEGLNIYFGDNYIFDNSMWRGLKILTIQDIFYSTPNAVTVSQLPNRYDIYLKDKEVYGNVIRSKGLDPKIWCPEYFGKD